MPSPPPDPEQVRAFLAERRLRRHGWARFQAGTRRTAIRMVRRMAEEETAWNERHTDNPA
jgi:hypothetical protein